MVEVIHLHDAPKDWQSNPQYVYIGRGNRWKKLPRSRWANPFSIQGALAYRGIQSEKDLIKRHGKVLGKRIYGIHEHQCREVVINQFEAYLTSQRLLMSALPMLAGKILVCWCKPEICHGDVIAAEVRRFERKQS